MNEISIGAVGAALIAGLISLLGLIIGKEQKVSEFRQAWIEDLRKCLVAYLVHINAICDILQLKNANQPFDQASLLTNYKSLNEASHGITLRVNALERPTKALLDAMSDFETLAKNNSSLTPENIRKIEENFISASKELLKFEWQRVRKGEGTFVITKRVVIATIIVMLFVLFYAIAIEEPDNKNYNYPYLEYATIGSKI